MATAATPKWQFKGPLKRRREQIADELVKKGVIQADAQRAVGQIGDGTLLRLLFEHLDDIAAIVLNLLG